MIVWHVEFIFGALLCIIYGLNLNKYKFFYVYNIGLCNINTFI